MPATAVAALWEMELRQRLIDHDHAALAECYDQYCSLVYTVALRTTGDRSAADDVTQEVFLKLWSRPVSLDLTKGTTRAWLGRVAHNRAVDWVRSEAAQSRRQRSDVSSAGPPDVQEALDAVLRAEEVRAALEGLPADERTAIRLAYFSNMTYQNVAVLGVDHVHASELLGAYVLDSCGDVEAEEIRLHIEGCAECTEEIDRLGFVAGFIGATDVESPPRHLRALVLSAARDMPPDLVPS